MPEDPGDNVLAILLATISEKRGIAVDEIVAMILTQLRPIPPDARDLLLQTVAPKARQLKTEFEAELAETLPRCPRLVL
jgi:hypothetical protein